MAAPGDIGHGQDARLRTSRLELRAATAAMLRAELAGRDALGAHLGADVPADWPPGEHDEGAVRHFLAQLAERGEQAAGWLAWYALELGEAPVTPRALVGSCGYFGPPADGRVEIGYSVVAAHRGRGLATEMVRALVARAFAHAEVEAVEADSRLDNLASNAVLARCGFRPAGAARTADARRWALPRAAWSEPVPGGRRAAAVLVPLVRDAAGAWRIVIVRRAPGGIHGDQLAFAGGRREAGDATLLAAALREAHEEIGLEPDAVRVLAELPAIDVRASGHHVTPYLAIVRRPERWRLDPGEIAEVLEPTLAELLAPGARDHADDLWPGLGPGVRLPFYRVGPHRLWGASERILQPLLERVRAREWPELLA